MVSKRHIFSLALLLLSAHTIVRLILLAIVFLLYPVWIMATVK
jgi:hypothetical protein